MACTKISTSVCMSRLSNLSKSGMAWVFESQALRGRGGVSLEKALKRLEGAWAGEPGGGIPCCRLVKEPDQCLCLQLRQA